MGLAVEVELEDAPPRALGEIGRSALLEDRERFDAFVARSCDIAVRGEQARRSGADLSARDRKSEAEGVLETLGAPRVSDREVAARARDLDQGRCDPGSAAATLVFDRRSVRGRGVLPRVLERALIQRQARQLRGDARRKVGPCRGSLGDGARFGKCGRGLGEVAALDRERTKDEQGRCWVGRLRSLREWIRQTERASKSRLRLSEATEPEERAAESAQRAGFA